MSFIFRYFCFSYFFSFSNFFWFNSFFYYNFFTNTFCFFSIFFYNTSKNATEDVKYKIQLVVDTNTLTPAAEGQFVNTLTGTSSKTEGAGTLVSVAESAVPETTTDFGQGILKGYETHTYTYTIQFKESNKDQNAAQGKAFGAKLQVNLVTE